MNKALKFQKNGKSSDLIRETEESIQAIVLFQSAMEAVITEEIENEPLLEPIKKQNLALFSKHKSLSFKNKWEKTFEILAIKNKKSLEKYVTFYSTHRIPISHPKSRFISVEPYSSLQIEAGIQSGWEAMQELFKTLGKETMSWKKFMNT